MPRPGQLGCHLVFSALLSVPAKVHYLVLQRSLRHLVDLNYESTKSEFKYHMERNLNIHVGKKILEEKRQVY